MDEGRTEAAAGATDRAFGARLDAGGGIEEIAAWLDGLDHAGRLREVQALRPGQLRRLHAAAEGRHCELEHFAPAALPPGREIVHHGVNSLPLIGGTFRKRMCRDAQDPDLLWGYNDSDGVVARLGWFTGPGYFAVRARGCPNPDGRQGCTQLFVNYFDRPLLPPVPGWPDPKPPLGLGAALVFGQMCDYMWAVSAHVSIGAAWKKGKPVGQYFALVREDPGPPPEAP